MGLRDADAMGKAEWLRCSICHITNPHCLSHSDAQAAVAAICSGMVRVLRIEQSVKPRAWERCWLT